MELVDVAIVGGGPSGSAAAISLRAHAPSLSIALIEASAYEAPRLGETLPPPGRRLLEHLGAWDAFTREPHQPSYGTVAAWGAAAPHEESFIYSPYGRGWHLDRRAFDAWLAAEAAARGVCVRRSTRVRHIDRVDRIGEGWRLMLESSDGPRQCRARFVVDATGASARVARTAAARSVAADRLVAFARAFDGAGSRASQTLVEAFDEGWWYTAMLPDGSRIVACFTDPDIARARRLSDPTSFSCLLARMPVVRCAVGDAWPAGPVTARSVASRCLDCAAGDDWLAVGDAASVFDPLSSQGVLKALRSGVFASYAITDALVRRDTAGLDRYRHYVRAEFDAYLATRAKYYAQEQRWPDRPFWRRRHADVAEFRHRATWSRVSDVKRIVLLVVLLLVGAAFPAWAQVTLTQTPEQIAVSIDGKPFTVLYVAGRDLNRPYLDPLRTASGRIVTRSVPAGQRPGETTDHPHHAGLFYGHGNVNGFNYWAIQNVPTAPGKTDPMLGQIVLDKVVSVTSGAESGSANVVFTWLTPAGKPLLIENRTMTFRTGPELRIVDVDLDLAAVDQVVFRDTKEGTFALRMAAPLEEPQAGSQAPASAAPRTGLLRNAQGGERETNVWGKRSEWVDYAGELEGEKIGIVMMDHPANPRHPTYWHSRGYGLHSINPFGVSDFLRDKTQDGSLTLAPGQHVRFRYRVVVHQGLSPARIAALYQQYTRM